MPNLSWNVQQWDEQYRWDLRGEEWSSSWGSSETQWFATLYPRLHRHLPATRILEIAPGFGRWTRFLLENCEEYIGIDLSEECVNACRERFRKFEKARFFKNDGLSLGGASGQYDFVFSFDSLVHADVGVLNSYIPAILKILSPAGVAFIHHSNFRDSGETTNVHYRSEDVSAAIVREIIEQNGGGVIVQETINWGSDYLIDCLTIFGSGVARDEPIIFANNKFMDEADNAKHIMDRYSSRRTISIRGRTVFGAVSSPQDKGACLASAGQPVMTSWRGRCPICEQNTVFEAQDMDGKPVPPPLQNSWFRDHLICQSCPGGSVPRDRAVMQVIRELAPDWKTRTIHESSPGGRGTSVVLARDCPGYVATQFFADTPRGAYRDGMRCEDLEQQTFADESFDLVVTQDVMEHVFHPDRVYREIWRTLKPGGLYLHTTPIYKDRLFTRRCASIGADGKVIHLAEPEYHGNPVDPKGSLVTFHYGYDLADLIAEWTPFDVEIRRFHQRSSGIVAEFSEVIICRKG